MFQSLIAKFYPTNWWPAYSKPYVFTSDWFTYRIRIWKKILKPLMESTEPVLALEIGTHEGRSAIWLLENVLTHDLSRLICIDPYSSETMGYANRFHQNLKIGNFEKKVKLLLQSSRDALSQFEKASFDLIYIDGDHDAENIKTDAENCWPLLKCGGTLIFDDYKWPGSLVKHQSPKHVIDQFLDEKRIEIKILYKGYQVLVKKMV